MYGLPKYFLPILWLLSVGCNRSEVMSDSVYGNAGEVLDVIPVEAALSEPQVYLGQSIAIRGTVHEICQMKGCWFMLRSADSGEGLRVHTDMKEDGDYLFTVPRDISGRHAIVYGKIKSSDHDLESHFQEDASGKAPLLSMVAVGVRITPEES